MEQVAFSSAVASPINTGNFSKFTSSDRIGRAAVAPGSPTVAFKPSANGNGWTSPTASAIFYDGITSHTTIQSAMIRERAFVTSNSAGEEGKVQGASIWGSIKVPPPPGTAGSRSDTPRKGLSQDILNSFEQCFHEAASQEPNYAIGQTSSVSFKMASPKDGKDLNSNDFVPQAYRKHLGIEPQNPSTNGPSIMVSDRAPESVIERRRRRELHKHIVTAKASSKPFNRKALAGSLSDYAEERMVLSKLTGDCHASGDLADIGPPRVKLWMNPKDNAHVTYVKSNPRYGRRVASGRPPSNTTNTVLQQQYEIDTDNANITHDDNNLNRGASTSSFSPSNNNDEGGHKNALVMMKEGDLQDIDPDFTMVRPRTTGYSPGHIRSIRKKNLSLSPNGSGGSAAAPVMSATARRIQYCNQLHEAKIQAAQKLEMMRSNTDNHDIHSDLSDEVEEGIKVFEKKLMEMKAKGWKGV